MPGDAVREARQRVRIAVGNSGFKYPLMRVLVNLAPAGVKKAGAAFDLPIALAILMASGQIDGDSCPHLVALGELELSGAVRSVAGVLAAAGVALENGVRHLVVPAGNGEEARALGEGQVWAAEDLPRAADFIRRIAENKVPPTPEPDVTQEGTSRRRIASRSKNMPDYSDMRGQVLVKRAMEVAAAGGHNVLLFGPQGVGKSMAAQRLSSILPPLKRSDALIVTRLHSLAGILGEHVGMVRQPVIRAPHHSASLEGMLGGGRTILPGEVSLAHKGVLFLDEATEYRRNVLQALREPCETGSVTIVRAGQTHTFPAAFQLVAAANPCACGNLGHPQRRCMCSVREIERYWKRFGGPLLDRIDMRILVQPDDPETIISDGYGSSAEIRCRVLAARERQDRRLADVGVDRNADLAVSDVRRCCRLTEDAEKAFIVASRKLVLSTRAVVSVLKLSRTIADLAGGEVIEKDDVLEAVTYRRAGEISGMLQLSGPRHPSYQGS